MSKKWWTAERTSDVTGKTERKKFRSALDALPWCRRVTQNNWAISRESSHIRRNSIKLVLSRRRRR